MTDGSASYAKRRRGPVCKTSLEQAIAEAQAAFEQGDWSQALTNWDHVFAACSATPEPSWYEKKAAVLLKLDRFAEAEPLYAWLCDECPANPAGFAGLAFVATQKGLFEKARERWQHCL